MNFIFFQEYSCGVLDIYQNYSWVRVLILDCLLVVKKVNFFVCIRFFLSSWVKIKIIIDWRLLYLLLILWCFVFKKLWSF